jgi:hydroxymethylglutaryl-CoA reductase (NADPH)
LPHFNFRDAIFFLLFLIDLTKAGFLARIALSGSNSLEVTNNIARGMETLGPILTLDTLVEALVIGVGTLSGVHRLAVLSNFAVMSVLVNYVVFMTFYPACLSLTLDLSRNGSSNKNNLPEYRTRDQSLIHALNEEDAKQNPIIQRVKLIMSSGLMIVHLHSRYLNLGSDSVDSVEEVPKNLNLGGQTMNKTEPFDFTDYLMRWVSISTEQIFILILLLALCVKFIFFDRDNFPNQFQMEEEERQRRVVARRKKTSHEELSASRRALFSISEENFTKKDSCAQTDLTSRDVYGDSDEEKTNFIETDDTAELRTIEECVALLSTPGGPDQLTDDEILNIIEKSRKDMPLHMVESILENFERGVKIRRRYISQMLVDKPVKEIFSKLSYRGYDYKSIHKVCCENVLGFVEIPVGYAGPLRLDNVEYYVPMATTEGALVASTNRGCKALSIEGVRSIVEDVGMTRAPCVKFSSISKAIDAKHWIEKDQNFADIKIAFDSTSKFAKLQEIHIAMDGPNLYMRFRSFTGDAMGMNMVSKGSEKALEVIKKNFPDMEIISLSGNFCSDKKPAAINWIKGRGKRVVCEGKISQETLKVMFKTDAQTMVRCNKLKNMAGSALAGSIGGNNAHAANMVTAIFIATGQDPAQNITSSNCSTNMELHHENPNDLYITCTMPSLEVGTIGGGTSLPGQSACLQMLGVKGAHPEAGTNSKRLASIICATVMAGELSLMAALVKNQLVSSHMTHNR